MKEKSRYERTTHFFETINSFGSELMRTTSAGESAWCATKHAVGELGYVDCLIYLINDDGELYQSAAHGNKNSTIKDVLSPIKLKMGEGLCGHVALTTIGEIIPDISKSSRCIVDDKDRCSELAVPILSDGIVVGIIDARHPEKDYFSNHDLNIFTTIASMLAFKISQEKALKELDLINKELAYQNEEKQKRADELATANKKYAYQNEEKQKRANELVIANTKLAYQNEEEQKRADELAMANKKYAYQNEEKEKRAEELVIANTKLAYQNREKEKRADALAISNKQKQKQSSELIIADKREQKQANELNLANIEHEFQKKLKKRRTETESIAKELRQFIETANSPIFGIDKHGLVNEWNQTSEKITGFKKEEVLSQNLVKTYIAESHQEQVKELLGKALKGEDTASYEVPLFAKDGRRVMILLNSSTRRNSEGEIIGVFGVGQDITILNEYKENLESKVKTRTQEVVESLEREKELGLLKTKFVSMASHEFRTPLTSIKATSDIILRYYDKLSREDIDERLKKIKREVEEMTIMLEDILIIGKSDAQKLDYNPELLDIVSLIKDIISEYQLSESENRQIVYEISDPVICVEVDRKWIKHIVLNILSNAIKYSDEGKVIEITIKQRQAGVSFCFKDYGMGIPKEDIKLLFEPFHRGENVKNISGTGLGLAVLKKAVELHRGIIEINSELGEGSHFRVILPGTKER
ncbi:MAG: PAS domain S-box-containing protein [Maribacter sp.]|jgi:PAS domain S-box-containing protein